MPNFGPIITLAYQRILGRNPDPGGLASWNRAMNDGLTEAGMREGLLRSPEYAQNHPLGSARTEPPGARRARQRRRSRSGTKAGRRSGKK
jgi:hypothetical protein